MAEPQQYFLKWNNYLRQLTCALDNHRAHDEFVDVTLLCEGRKITAHKVVLSSCSSYFKDIFSENPHPHPLLIFNFIKYEDLNSIIKFMYQGEVNVKQEGLDSFLQLAKVLSVHGLNTEGTNNDSIPQNIDRDSIPSNIVTSIPEPVRVLRSTSTDTNRQIQTLLKLARENQAQTTLSTSIDTTTTHPTPSCSQSSYKKRKLIDTYNDNDISGADDRDEQAAVNVDDIASRDCMITNLPEYLLGQSNDHPSAIDPLQEINQNLDYNVQNVANIKTEYDILVESDTEEKYTPTDDAEMTIETRRLTNPSTPHVHAKLDFTASCSNAATGNEGASSETSNEVIEAIHNLEHKVDFLTNEVGTLKQIMCKPTVLLEELVKTSRPTPKEFNIFPINSLEELNSAEELFETKLDSEVISYMKLKFDKIKLEKALSNMIGENILLKVNWDGSKNKTALNKYKLFNFFFFEALKDTFSTYGEFEKAVKQGFRKCKATFYRQTYSLKSSTLPNPTKNEFKNLELQ